MIIVVLALVANAQLQAMVPDVQDSVGAISALKKATADLRTANDELQKAEDVRDSIELQYDKQSQTWKREIKSISNHLVSQIKLVNTVNTGATRQAVVVEALQKIMALLKQIENLKSELSEQKNLYMQQEKVTVQYANELQATKERLEVLAKLSTPDKALLEEQVKLLQVRYETLKSIEASVRQQAQAHEAALVEAEQEFTKQLAAEQSKAQAQENKIRQDLDQVLNLLPKTSAKEEQQIEKLKLGIQLLESRLDSQRARADKLWIELQSAQQKPTGNPIARFFNWVRGRNKQAANQ